MEITTDPVELWAAPHSRARSEKDFFDNTFGPFYRTAQIFIKPVTDQNVIHSPQKYHSDGRLTIVSDFQIVYEKGDDTMVFGPVYNQTFLEAVFKLQDSIIQLGQDESAGIENVCFAPMATGADNEKPTVSKCVVQSIYGFFKNSMDNFQSATKADKTSDAYYLSRLDTCLRYAFLGIWTV